MSIPKVLSQKSAVLRLVLISLGTHINNAILNDTRSPYLRYQHSRCSFGKRSTLNHFTKLLIISKPSDDPSLVAEARDLVAEHDARSTHEAGLDSREPFKWMDIQRHTLDDDRNLGGHMQRIIGHYKWGRRELETREPVRWMDIQRHGLQDEDHLTGQKQNIMGHFKWNRRELVKYIMARALEDHDLLERFYDGLEDQYIEVSREIRTAGVKANTLTLEQGTIESSLPHRRRSSGLSPIIMSMSYKYES